MQKCVRKTLQKSCVLHLPTPIRLSATAPPSKQFYFGFRFHCVCSAMGVIEHYDLSPAHIHDINFLHDIKDIFSNCVLIGDKGDRYTPWRLTLFEYAGIELSVPSKSNERLQYLMPFGDW